MEDAAPVTILLLDADLRYVNPTRALWVRVLEQIGETRVFGPGYVSAEELRAGVRVFAERHGPFDVVIATEHIALAPAELFSLRHYRRNFVTSHDPDTLLPACQRIAGELDRVAGLHVASLMETDFQYLTSAKIACLAQFPLVIGLGAQFVPSTPVVTEEAFLGPITDAWRRFVEATPARIVSLPMFVSDTASCSTALESRPYDWAIPGVAYRQRHAMRQRLTANAHWRVRGAPIRWGGALSTVGLRPWTSDWFVSQYQARFARDLRSSKYAYTCGSSLRYPVLKFFEIPAAGALLVCHPCRGFAALGFVHGVHALAGDDQAVLEQTVLRARPERLQAIARAGRTLVLSTHTVQARAAQLHRVLTVALDHRYHGSHWAAGCFVVDTPAAIARNA